MNFAPVVVPPVQLGLLELLLEKRIGKVGEAVVLNLMGALDCRLRLRVELYCAVLALADSQLRASDYELRVGAIPDEYCGAARGDVNVTVCAFVYKNLTRHIEKKQIATPAAVDLESVFSYDVWSNHLCLRFKLFKSQFLCSLCSIFFVSTFRST